MAESYLQAERSMCLTRWQQTSLSLWMAFYDATKNSEQRENYDNDHEPDETRGEDAPSDGECPPSSVTIKSLLWTQDTKEPSTVRATLRLVGDELVTVRALTQSWIISCDLNLFQL